METVDFLADSSISPPDFLIASFVFAKVAATSLREIGWIERQ
jgi:hypothetical protein